MPRIIEKTVYLFDELSDKSKEKARDWFRSCSDTSDLDNVTEDFAQIAKIIGLELDMRSVPLMSGKSRQEPEIYYSVSYSQSDYAAFSGTWKYKAGCLKAIKAYAPQDRELIAIVSDWYALQKINFYRLRAICSERRGNQYVNEVESDNYVTQETHSEAEDIVVRLASWLYAALREECDYQSSAEYVDECIRANEYEFTEEGELA